MDDASYTALLELRTELQSLLNVKAQKAFLATRRLFHEHGNKCGRLLARALRHKLYISKLRTPQGSHVTLPRDMIALLQDHFHHLYNLPQYEGSTPPPSLMLQFRRKNVHTKLSLLQRTALESPFTIEELSQSVKKTPTGKTPGPDRFSLRYYKVFFPSLAPAWLAAFNTLIQRPHSLPPQTLAATITLIPKPGKDPDVCANYRPISLLNQDIKLFAQAIALRLARYVPGLVHPDQAGFVPGREARDNTVRALNLIHSASHPKSEPTLLLSTDAEKAFERVRWAFLFQTLRCMGFGPNLMAWIGALYSCPSARINLNGILSPSFPIQNGTRQGCPLSPMLFALSLEPLLQAVRTDTSIHGVKVGLQHHKVAVYADDLLFFVSQHLMTLPSLTALLRKYSSYSHYKINLTKSENLGVNIPLSTSTQLQAAFPFRWRNSAIKYLGVQLTSDLSTLYSTNFLPLLQSISSDLASWAFPHVTWFGRIHDLKMNILPRILYLFQTLPITVPRLFFSSLQSIFIKYVCNSLQPRLKFSLLTASKLKGGLALPNLKQYYQATHLLCISEWSNKPSQKLPQEGDLTGDDLASLPWLLGIITKCTPSSHPTVSATLKIWKSLQRSTTIAPWPSPLLPVNRLPVFSRCLPRPGRDPADPCLTVTVRAADAVKRASEVQFQA
uniref:Reverse transcriptase domain-containing protein n=1 Tax=Leptobrachium leishanense TaxID=445787 RepID=A0A8C5MVA5_9ANUR